MALAENPDTEVHVPSAEGASDAAFLVAMGRHVRDVRERRGMARKALSQSAGV
jgi:hypothetical protein